MWPIFRDDHINMQGFKSNFFKGLDFERALAKMANLKVHTYHAIGLEEVAKECLLHWDLVACLFYALREVAMKFRIGKAILPQTINDAPFCLREGADWFESKIRIMFAGRIIARYFREYRTIPCSLGELRKVYQTYADISQPDGPAIETMVPCAHRFGILLPMKANDMFNTRKTLHNAIRNAVLGRPTTVNKNLVELAWPGRWQRAMDKCQVMHDENAGKYAKRCLNMNNLSE